MTRQRTHATGVAARKTRESRIRTLSRWLSREV